ncbi:LacI family transcriptional regulator [Alkalihalobacillus oceani]|uniref:LacI family DNA-binding transcriptional regulator n=1 Tax=Halalkalibacter oceani TaxID=1653776 RepID=UPI00203EAABA|nr:LacI family DNA-binding transcriptional regulator [Halalkalibacter oceani]MCM3760772.1 LacI family transcriptional regulator [Halalkalibacter oceani]
MNNKNKVNMDTIAKKAGVSKTTVSRIINGNFEYVNEATKEKVLRIIKELNYKPNSLARSLKQRKSNVIGLILANMKTTFWSLVIEGVEKRCHANGYSLMICNSNNDPLLEREHIENLKMKQVDGIIINPMMENKPLFEELIEEKYPLVLINRRIDDLPLDTVIIDNVRSSVLAVNHLSDLGRKSIALIAYHSQGISPRKDRIEGYRKAMVDNGFVLDERMIREVEEKPGTAKEAVKQLLLLPERPEAILSTHVSMISEVIEAANELELTIPNDISHIGFDESVWSQHLASPLTTVSQPSFEMGELAANHIIEFIKNKESFKPATTLLQPELIVRSSCGYNLLNRP